MALRLITDHIADCAQARKDTKAAINDVGHRLNWLIGVLIVGLMSFGGYTYNVVQQEAQDREKAMQQEIQAIRATPAATARAVVAQQTNSTEGQ